jgi:hypothetical protein
MIEAALTRCYGRVSDPSGAATKLGCRRERSIRKSSVSKSTNIGSKRHALAESILHFRIAEFGYPSNPDPL